MKKLIITILTVMFSVISFVAAENYSTELQGAYDYAYGMGVTTQSSIQAANMTGSLIRSHMAKMMVNYAKEVKGLPANTSLACTFTDVANETAELQGFIKEACQMGIMGQDITEFNPNGIVTRAQFGTVLSRVLYGDANNGGNPYYANHLAALKNASIMTNISNPNTSEIRGYVMLMMQRAENSNKNIINTTLKSQCESQINQLLCLIESSDCPLECKENEIVASSGILKVNTTSINIGILPEGKKYIGSLKFTAIDDNVFIKKISFNKLSSFTKGWIEYDGVKIVNIQQGLLDQTITKVFSPLLNIKKGEYKILNFFIESDNKEIQGVTMLNATNIQSSANSIEGDFPYKIMN